MDWSIKKQYRIKWTLPSQIWEHCCIWHWRGDRPKKSLNLVGARETSHQGARKTCCLEIQKYLLLWRRAWAAPRGGCRWSGCAWLPIHDEVHIPQQSVYEAQFQVFHRPGESSDSSQSLSSEVLGRDKMPYFPREWGWCSTPALPCGLCPPPSLRVPGGVQGAQSEGHVYLS